MANRIKGITVEIGGDTAKLSKALESVDTQRYVFGSIVMSSINVFPGTVQFERFWGICFHPFANC